MKCKFMEMANLSSAETAAMLLAAAVHDYEHPFLFFFNFIFNFIFDIKGLNKCLFNQYKERLCNEIQWYFEFFLNLNFFYLHFLIFSFIKNP